MDEQERKSKVQAGKEAVGLWYSCTMIRCEYSYLNWLRRLFYCAHIKDVNGA